jgi:hypothetical protein
MYLHRSIRWLVLPAMALSCTSTWAETVDNPEYLAWASCKSGTTVTLKINCKGVGSGVVDLVPAALRGASVEMTSTEKLVEVMPDMAIISLSISAPRNKSLTKPMVVSAKIEKDALGVPSILSFLGPAQFSDVKDGKSSLEIKGATFEAKTYSLAIQATQGGPGGKTGSALVKAWYSPEVPGAFGRVEAVLDGKPDLTRTVTVVDFAKAAVAVARPPEELDDRTPQGMLRYADRHLPEGGMDLAKASYQATTTDGKELAQVSAILDYAGSRLEKAARDRFGAATTAVEKIDHALNENTRSDVEFSTVDVNGDKAVVIIGADEEKLNLLRINGHWRLDADAMAAALDRETLKGSIQFAKSAAVLADRLTKEINEGRYKTEEELEKAVQAGVDQIYAEIAKAAK